MAITYTEYDLTEYVKMDMGSPVSYAYGFQDEYGKIATPARMSFTLINTDNLFSPANTASVWSDRLVPDAIVELSVDTGSGYETLWVGKVEDVLPQVGQYTGVPTVQVLCGDPVIPLLSKEFVPTFEQDIRTDQAIQQVIDQNVFTYPSVNLFFTLDQSLLNQGVFWSDVVGDLDTNGRNIAYVGDVTNDAGTSARSFLNDVMEAEGPNSRLFWHAKNATLTFHSRYYDSLNAGTAIVYGNTLDGDTYGYVSAMPAQVQIANIVEATYYPRSVGTDMQVIYENNNTVRVGGNETKVVKARFRDPNTQNARLAVFELRQPERGVDYEANSRDDGTGADVSDLIRVRASEGATACEITIVNTSRDSVYVTSLQLRGVAVTAYEQEQVIVRDPDSIGLYGAKPSSIPLLLKYVDNQTVCEGIANAELNRRKLWSFRLRNMTVRGTNTTDYAAIDRDIGDLVRVKDSSTSHDSQYIIVGISGSITHAYHDVTYTLKPQEFSNVMVLGSGVLDQNTLG